MSGSIDQILFVPLDDRPCCLDMTERIAALSSCRLLTPARKALGHFQTPGDPTQILDWLESQDPCLPLIASLDMLSWGGLIASRHPDSDVHLAEAHFQRFCQIQERRTGQAFVFKTLLRTAPTQTTPEEVEQAEQIVALSRMSFLYAKNRVGPQAHSLKAAKDQLREGISPPILERYLEVRRRNHRFDSQVVSQAARFDALLIAMDDCQTEGWNLLEKERLEKQAVSQELQVDFYPGTDESAALLLCRMLAAETGFEPVWSHDHLPLTQTRYEDRPLGALLHAQVQAARLRQGRCARKLFLYGRMGTQKESVQQSHFGHSDSQSVESFLNSLESALDRGDSCVVADLAFANGGDLSLVEALIERGLAARLTGYSAWNTAGNTLGTALANLTLFPETPSPGQERARKVLLWERLTDDAFYQSRYRFRLKKELGPGLTLAGEELQRAHDLLTEEFHAFASELWSQLFPQEPPPAFTVRLPWGRLFEVAIEPREQDDDHSPRVA
ncbi:MAG: DUF4127 family protein [Vulcanimicrobiota bacterium]